MSSWEQAQIDLQGKFTNRDSLTEAEAQWLHDYVRNSGVIPLEFPNNGCWDRAHAMATLIKASGLSCRKIWVVSAYRLERGGHGLNPDLPDLRAGDWHVHVSPTLRVRAASGKVEEMVLDPIVFPSGPRPMKEWVANMRDPGCMDFVTPADVYKIGGPHEQKGGKVVFPSSDYGYDRDLVQTQRGLEALRRRGQHQGGIIRWDEIGNPE